MRILVVTTEPVPLPGFPTTGAGLRAWGLVQGLRSRGLDAEIAMPRDAVSSVDPEARARAEPFLFDRENLTAHVLGRKPDVVVMQHWGLMNRLGAEVRRPLAIDLHGPHLLERAFWGSASPERDLEQKIAALARADFLTCAGEFQRRYFLSFALQAGFDVRDPALLAPIPFSVSPETPPAGEHAPSTFFYGGILLPWQDPSVGIETLLETLESRSEGRLVFVAGRHPAGDVSGGRFDPIVRRLEGSERVSVRSSMTHDEFESTLRGCGVALDLMARNAERELAFTSRTVVYLAQGLPAIYNDYSELSQWIARYEAGWRLDPLDRDGLRAVLAGILDDPGEVRRRGENALRLVRERLTWDRTIDPLAAWCANPAVRAGKERFVPAAARLARLGTELDAARRSIDELSGRRLVKLSNLLRRLGWRR
ncbi:glycosyltransferase family 4 protein [Candidatus Sumerlaeota bacterium]|nr:glycosyltransferase family 4 protein [Candidatus Sumerlaeota bacterium]